MEQIILLLIMCITYIVILVGIVCSVAKWFKVSGKHKNAFIIALFCVVAHTVNYILEFYVVNKYIIIFMEIALIGTLLTLIEKFYSPESTKRTGMMLILLLSSLILTEILITPILTKIL